MNMTNEHINENVDEPIDEQPLQAIIERNADVLKAMRFSEQAAVHYCMLGDMIFWVDELPMEPRELLGPFRYLLHLRTQQAVTGKNIDSPLWYWFKAHFPLWPGFSAERCDPVRLSSLYEELYEPPYLPPD